MSLPNMLLVCPRIPFPILRIGTYARLSRSSLFAELPPYRTIPTYLALFIFAFFFDIVMSWDAIRLQNTIQVSIHSYS